MGKLQKKKIKSENKCRSKHKRMGEINAKIKIHAEIKRKEWGNKTEENKCNTNKRMGKLQKK